MLFFNFYNNIMLVQERNQLIYQIIKNIDDENSENTHNSQQRNLQKNNILLKKLSTRVFKNHHLINSHTSSPLFYTPIHHVYKLFNTFGVNQTALTTPDFQQSFLRTYFYHRRVTKVEKYRNAVVISIVPMSQQLNQPAFSYIVEKLKSYGNVELFRLASLIEELWLQIVELKNKKMDAIIQEDKESITKYLNCLGDQKFFCKFGLFKIALSNSLLQYLGYNVDEFCVQTIKYRTIMFDFLSSNGYHRIVYHALTTLKYLMDVDLNKMTPEDYLRLSRLQWADYVYSKDYKRSYCDIEYTIPVRGIICFLIKKVHYQVDQLTWRPNGCTEKKQKDSKKEINEKEFELLNKLGAIPSNWLSVSKYKVAGYRTIQSDNSSYSDEQHKAQ